VDGIKDVVQHYKQNHPTYDFGQFGLHLDRILRSSSRELGDAG
jgi:hypothetical protein